MESTSQHTPGSTPGLQEFSFTTPPAGPSYPLRMGLIGDVGQTYNSSDTFHHLAASKPQVLHV